MHYLKSIYQLVSCQGRNCFYSSIKKKMKKIEKVNKVKDLFRVHCASVFFSRLLWPRVIIDLHFSINMSFKITRYLLHLPS